jgi:septal ring factor EnvC (AmiA/AmiB activator)
VQTFTVRDLTRPTGPRTIRVLSAVCNFRAFADVEERRDFLRDLQTQAENKQQRLDERAAELQDVEEELASIQYATFPLVHCAL